MEGRRIVLNWNGNAGRPIVVPAIDGTRSLGDVQLVLDALLQTPVPTILEPPGTALTGNVRLRSDVHYLLSSPPLFKPGNPALLPSRKRSQPSTPPAEEDIPGTKKGPGSQGSLTSGGSSARQDQNRPGQDDFREALMQRDRCCIVTGHVGRDLLNACHIIPVSAEGALDSYPQNVQNGRMSIVRRTPSSGYEVFVLAPDDELSGLHGTKVLVPGGLVGRTNRPWADHFADAALLEFQFGMQ
ncbi:hypothetical protein HDU93_001134 [Gonapodya sp. JEL0774]|nr:hypothetical protein HDU93_001134 [Gonapodya sp. JEL0774]